MICLSNVDGATAAGALMPWEKAVKDHLKAAGGSDSRVMRAFRAGKKRTRIAPLSSAGCARWVYSGGRCFLGERYAFEGSAIPPVCLLTLQRSSFENNKFKAISCASAFPLWFLKTRQKSSLDLCVRLEMRVFENKPYRATGKTYAVAL